MDTVMKSIITEKDLLRQILLLEQLSNHPKITAKELASLIHTTERTIFSDIQYIRTQLPPDWSIEADSNGLSLIKHSAQLTHQLWESFFPLSIGVSLIKQLFFNKEVLTQLFLQDNGISYETLRRHITKINRSLKPYDIRIRLNSKEAMLLGNEVNIRIFFHRLLLPFTHNNYFFENYTIHESHYLRFLEKLKRNDLHVSVEQIFGTCWFFINTIRIKANCRVGAFSFEPKDPLFLQYQPFLFDVYQKEGVYLEESDCFFCFYCFLESWNYNNQWSDKVAETLEHYFTVKKSVHHFVADLDHELELPLSSETQLADNLLLMLLRANESANLSQQFQLEYQEIISIRHHESCEKIFERLATFLSAPDVVPAVKKPEYLLNTASLLVQQAMSQVHPVKVRAFSSFKESLHGKFSCSKK